jgi:hypothetical protein
MKNRVLPTAQHASSYEVESYETFFNGTQGQQRSNAGISLGELGKNLRRKPGAGQVARAKRQKKV